MITQHFRRQIIRRATKRARALVSFEIQTFLTHAVIREFNVTVSIEQDVVQFQIAIDDAVLVQEMQSDRDLSSIESEQTIEEEVTPCSFLPSARFR